MNDKQKKLLALYNDSSITIEEKRTIAVKLIDLGILEYSTPKNVRVEKEYVRYTINGIRQKKDVNEMFELYRLVNVQLDEVNHRLKLSLEKGLELEYKLEYETNIKSRLKLVFILLIVIDIIIIFTH